VTVNLQAIVLLLKKTAGKDFNPLLINNFLKALNGIGAFGLISPTHRNTRFNIVQTFQFFPQKISMLYDLTGMQHAPTRRQNRDAIRAEDFLYK
jgi:hypothetical protein